MQGVISYSSFCVNIVYRVRNKDFWANLKVAPGCVVIRYKLKVLREHFHASIEKGGVRYNCGCQEAY